MQASEQGPWSCLVIARRVRNPSRRGTIPSMAASLTEPAVASACERGPRSSAAAATPRCASRRGRRLGQADPAARLHFSVAFGSGSCNRLEPPGQGLTEPLAGIGTRCPPRARTRPELNPHGNPDPWPPESRKIAAGPDTCRRRWHQRRPATASRRGPPAGAANPRSRHET